MYNSNYIKILQGLGLLSLIFGLAQSVFESEEDYYKEDSQIIKAKELLRENFPDVDLTVPELIEREGYPCEVHEVITHDGFILQLHRIPHGSHHNPHQSNKEGTRRNPGRPVLIQHAALQSSADAIINGRRNSLAYQLADNGYDVWLGNFRGTTYSARHLNFTQKDRKYWDFSFHEMGIYDFRANIDYILGITRQRDLYYVGHAWGASAFLILTSIHPEYNEKIRLSILLAPAAFLAFWRSPLRFIAPIDIVGLLATSAWYGVIGDERVRPDKLLALVRTLAPGICSNDLIDNLACNNLMFLLEGYDYEQRNNSHLPAILARTPTTVSGKSLLHMEQIIMTNKFAQFNYGRIRNMELYGQRNPPLYDFSKITTKVAILWGPGDFMAAPKNVEMIVEHLPNVVAYHRVEHDKFNHYDFSYAKDAKRLVYDHCLRYIQMH